MHKQLPPVIRSICQRHRRRSVDKIKCVCFLKASTPSEDTQSLSKREVSVGRSWTHKESEDLVSLNEVRKATEQNLDNRHCDS